MHTRLFLKNRLISSEEGSILVIAFKIVTIYEGRTTSLDSDKDELIQQESNWFLPLEAKIAL